MQAPELVAVDWGTTNFRAYAIAPSGAIVDHIESSRGILSVEPGTFPRVLSEQLRPWLPLPGDCRVVIAGMAGSRQGWAEALYVQCPASSDDVARAVSLLTANDVGEVLLVPGVSCRGADGYPDVMRGEETQVYGTLGEGKATLCLPGTHSKWAFCDDGAIVSFETFMTGEMFDVIGKHTILARTMKDGLADDAEFERGINEARKGQLLHQLFTTRTRGLVDGLSGEGQRSFVSGLLIGAELKAVSAVLADDATVTVIGSPGLTSSYARGLGLLGHKAEAVEGATAFARGAQRLFRLWRGGR